MITLKYGQEKLSQKYQFILQYFEIGDYHS